MKKIYKEILMLQQEYFLKIFYEERHLTCLTSCRMVLDKENVFVWILFIDTVLPSLGKNKHDELVNKSLQTSPVILFRSQLSNKNRQFH